MAKAQSKTQKKIDATIRTVLNDICEQAKGDLHGFVWLTHQADYSNFPASLLITCVFIDDQHIGSAQGDGALDDLRVRIQRRLLKAGVVLKKLEQQVVFDSEQACARQHDGDWSNRLASRAGRAVPRNRPH